MPRRSTAFIIDNTAFLMARSNSSVKVWNLLTSIKKTDQSYQTDFPKVFLAGHETVWLHILQYTLSMLMVLSYTLRFFPISTSLGQSPGQRQSPGEQHTSLATQHTPVGVGHVMVM